MFAVYLRVPFGIRAGLFDFLFIDRFRDVFLLQHSINLTLLLGQVNGLSMQEWIQLKDYWRWV